MISRLLKLFLLASLATAVGCSTEAQPIQFGHDQCTSCKMTIVEKQFAAQCVTKKGKQFKYDAIECMARAINQSDDEQKLARMLVSNYSDGTMIPAEQATYLICPEIKSPMGGFLSAYQTKDAATTVQAEHGGEVYTWQGLKEQLSKQDA
jgi:copper chaperone NosL